MKTRIENVSRSFKNFVAVQNINLELEPNKIYGLIGPNGAGKTTLMLMLAGLLQPTLGSIYFNGIPFDGKNNQMRKVIGWMPDNFGIWGDLKSVEILSLFGQLYGMNKNYAYGRALELLTLVNLQEYAEQKSQVLSRGQKQRLGLARALIHAPELLILDEPSSGMDPQSRVALRELIKYISSQGPTILISSHILSDLDELADESLFMNKGILSKIDSKTSDTKVLEIVSNDGNKLYEWGQKNNFVFENIAPNIFQTNFNILEYPNHSTIIAKLLAEQINIESFNLKNASLEQEYLKKIRGDS